MADDRQRYCPHCDRAFLPGEAVLSCSTCARLHHPACWVKFHGCSAGCEDAHPDALAYEAPEPRREGPHPAEGTRVAGQQPVIGARPPRDPVEHVGPGGGETQPGATASGAPGEETIGARSRPNAGGPGQKSDPVVMQPPPRAQRGRYVSPDSRPPVEDLRLYRRRGILRYWYVPVAAVLAILVAVGIVWGADRFLGGEGDEDPDDVPAEPADDEDEAESPTPESPFDEETPAGDEEPGAGEDGTPAGETATPPDSDDATPPADGEFSPGQTVAVAGTGGDGLNLRSEPGTGSDILASLADGSEITIVDGPTEQGNFTWWQVDAGDVQGWVAADFLEPAGE
ncbi:MAG: SH3 domain-containing protein [Dehalococcoidia bacterium]|nr:SH3 domain-containing protein [Dehalococcoidia bacterium]